MVRRGARANGRPSCHPEQADCNLGPCALGGARGRGPTLVCFRDGGWFWQGGRSHDPSSPQAGPRGFDLRVPDDTKPPVCSWAGLGKVPLRRAQGGPFWPLPAPQRHRSSALTEPSGQWTDGSPLALSDPGHQLGEAERALCLDSDSREKRHSTAPW